MKHYPRGCVYRRTYLDKSTRQRKKAKTYTLHVLLRETKIPDPATGAIKVKVEQKEYPTQCTTLGDANTALRKLLDKIERNEDIAPSALTVGEYLTQWLARVTPTLRPHSVVTYRWAIKHLTAALGDVRLQQLGAWHVTDWVAAASKRHRPKGVRLIHGTLYTALKSAVKLGMVLKNAAADIENLPVDDESADDFKRKCLTDDETRRVLKAAKADGRQVEALLAFLFDSGARVSEACGLKWSDLDWATGCCTIQRQLAEPPKSRHGFVPPEFGDIKTGRKRKSKVRVITLAPETVKLLRRHKAAQPVTRLGLDMVFATTVPHPHPGVPLSQDFVRAIFKRVTLRAIGRALSPHSARHTAATSMLAARESINVVQRHLGHSKTETTLDIYAHTIPEHFEQAAARRGERLYGRG